MLFWIAAAGLTALACMSVLSPYLRKRETGTTRAEHELTVYRDQLDEVERDRARRLIEPAEAEQARAEIGRRILRIADRDRSGARGGSGRTAKAFAMAGVLSVPILSWGIYGSIGSPQLDAQPLAARLQGDPATLPVETMVRRIEERLRADPQDGRGWDVIAPVYLRMGRAADAANAYRKASEFLGESADRLAGLGEALVAEGQGAVSPEARTAFEEALKLSSDNDRSKFYLALASFQSGDLDAARQQLTALRDEGDQNSPWTTAAARALTELDGTARAGPTADDVNSAQALDPADQTAMIESMVAGLDERLKQNPDDLEGWQRLVRSYVVMGRPDAAREALSRGLEGLGPESKAAADLQEFAAAQGVPAEIEP